MMVSGMPPHLTRALLKARGYSVRKATAVVVNGRIVQRYSGAHLRALRAQQAAAVASNTDHATVGEVVDDLETTR